jgi:hypothetical protein
MLRAISEKPADARPATTYSWKLNIVTTVFVIGDRRGRNTGSAWDPKWQKHYGGFDDPNSNARKNYIPTGFTPQLNPFYVALPYNDIMDGRTKPEALTVIPWFRLSFQKEGKSVCMNRWVAIRRGNRVAYAQWSDCGPFSSTHWQYVFGSERPKPNANQGAGLNVSPAVRDYLRMQPTDVTDWKFVEFREVPPGPWSQYGENNDFVIMARRTTHEENRCTLWTHRRPSRGALTPIPL